MASQQQLDSALKAWQDAANQEQSWKVKYETCRSAYKTCKEARDKKSTGPGKNKACHINTLNAHLGCWDQSYKAYQIAANNTVQKKKNYDNIKKAYDDRVAQEQAEIAAQTALQQADPGVAIQKEKTEQAIALAEKEKEKAAQEQQAKNKRYIIIGVVAVIVVVGSVIIWKVLK